MVKISLKFNKWSRTRIELGRKRATSRKSRKGSVGDVFSVCDQDWVLTDVFQIEQKRIKDYLWKVEGCINPDEYVRVWNKCYPNMKYRDGRKVWFHRFREMEDE